MSYLPFPRLKYAAPEGSTLKNYLFFNGAVIGATPKIRAPTVSKVRVKFPKIYSTYRF